jgi:peptidoglycan hydrolase FlgJ
MVASAAMDARFSGLVNRAMAQVPKSGLAADGGAGSKPAARAWAEATDFETVFVSTMFQSMFTDIGNEGPMGSSTGVAPWRSFLTQEYAKNFVQKGGIGLAAEVYRQMMAKQAARASQAAAAR